MGKLKGTIAYGAGPMDRVEGGGREWREEISKFLHSRGIGFFNPCEKPAFEAFEDEHTRERVNQLKKEKRYTEVREIMELIAWYDLRMCDFAHYIILYIDSDVHMCGSYHEFVIGLQQQKPILIISKKGIEAIPNWIFAFVPYETMFSSIGECCDYLDKIDRGVIIPSSKKWKFFDYTKVFKGDISFHT